MSNATPWIVWCPERGAEKEDGRRIMAYSAEDAAVQWAAWDDAEGADYSIVGGSPAEVVVLDGRDGTTEYRFTVYGEACPVYRAHQH